MIERLSTGVEGLDRLLNGGFHKGSAYIIQGPPGAGKTILANQFCFSYVKAGGCALYMSLLAESHDRMLSYMSALDFYDPSVVPGKLQYLSGYGVLEREGLAGLAKLIQHEIKRLQAGAVVLDGVFVANSNASEAEFRKFVHELQGVANFSDASIVMLTHQDRGAGSPEHTMVDGWIELSDELDGFRAYRTLQVRKHRGSRIVRGKHRFRITDKGVSVFPRLEMTVGETPPASVPANRVLTGVRDIDAILSGGLTEGSATLVVGPTGSGKTMLGLHFLAQATVDEPGIMLCFYESPARLVRKAESIGLDLAGAMASGVVDLMWRQPSGNVVDELAWALVERVKETGARRVVIDRVNVLRDDLIAPERLPHVLDALTSHLRGQGATMLYSQEQDDIQGAVAVAGEVSPVVDNILILTFLRQQNALRRMLSILKLRDSDFEPTLREFHVDSQGIVLGPRPRLDTGPGA